MKSLHTQIAALYVMQAHSQQEWFAIQLACEPNDTCVNWTASVGSISGSPATNDKDALLNLRDAMIDRCRDIARDIGVLLPAFEAIQKEERGDD